MQTLPLVETGPCHVHSANVSRDLRVLRPRVSPVGDERAGDSPAGGVGAPLLSLPALWGRRGGRTERGSLCLHWHGRGTQAHPARRVGRCVCPWPLIKPPLGNSYISVPCGPETSRWPCGPPSHVPGPRNSQSSPTRSSCRSCWKPSVRVRTSVRQQAL